MHQIPSCAAAFFVFFSTSAWARIIAPKFFRSGWQWRIQRFLQIRNIFRLIGLKANDVLPTMPITLLCNVSPPLLVLHANNYRIFSVPSFAIGCFLLEALTFELTGWHGFIAPVRVNDSRVLGNRATSPMLFTLAVRGELVEPPATQPEPTLVCEFWRVIVRLFNAAHNDPYFKHVRF